MEPQPTMDAALDKMVDWLERMAGAIKLREPNDNLKIFK